jgi:hypothetical protein
LQAQDNVKSDNSAATIVLFARTTTIALLDADNFDAYTAWMMSYNRHAAFGNEAQD